jgi:hypothetical protein
MPRRSARACSPESVNVPAFLRTIFSSLIPPSFLLPGGHGPLLARGSHRSGRAGLPHPAPRSNVRRAYAPFSLACVVALRCSLGSVSQTSVLPQACLTDPPLPFAGSPGAASPTSSVLSADSDFSAPVRPRFVALAWPYHAALWLRSRSGAVPPMGQGLVSRRPTASLRGETETSQVPGESLCAHAPLSDPGGFSKPSPSTGRKMLPSAVDTASAPQ